MCGQQRRNRYRMQVNPLSPPQTSSGRSDCRRRARPTRPSPASPRCSAAGVATALAPCVSRALRSAPGGQATQLAHCLLLGYSILGALESTGVAARGTLGCLPSRRPVPTRVRPAVAPQGNRQWQSVLHRHALMKSVSSLPLGKCFIMCRPPQLHRSARCCAS